MQHSSSDFTHPSKPLRITLNEFSISFSVSQLRTSGVSKVNGARLLLLSARKNQGRRLAL